MNWANFQTYNDAPTKAFEILCNQLFENWCKEQYTSELASFHVVNGAGGDGGVESYAVLSDGKVIVLVEALITLPLASTVIYGTENVPL